MSIHPEKIINDIQKAFADSSDTAKLVTHLNEYFHNFIFTVNDKHRLLVEGDKLKLHCHIDSGNLMIELKPGSCISWNVFKRLCLLNYFDVTDTGKQEMKKGTFSITESVDDVEMRFIVTIDFIKRRIDMSPVENDFENFNVSIPLDDELYLKKLQVVNKAVNSAIKHSKHELFK